jgi:hypothetical protein
MAICVGVIFATTSIGALSEETVDRTHKGDRLPVAQVSVPRVPVYGLPEGCDALVSSLVHSGLERIAGRCVS